ncbi:hypothetical protein EP30_05440 [Bifidobacterium sp. UTCIF-39]|uniref:hypothetical protein n=1 Tax=Bifidobacterium sp. UTCIF-39 TaxID=1465359 RepID=UPI0011282C3A|nr:hypothetical protein [Bifidobacterium sp. UTCIF-39]TPF96858.1 hypothetical protein EP30_05440 [Bifidobacterium sp. UTCIF-39]
MRTCAHCGKPLPVNMRSTAKYCGATCRKAAQRSRQGGAGPSRQTVKPLPKRDAKPGPLTGREFERMMDGKLEDVLRRNRDRLQIALDDPGTPATALPAISRQLIAVCRELDAMGGGDPLLDIEDEPMEVSEDAGASIV